ncbi:Ger(x)C family spore germination protein [Moorella sp. ACPs]|uniref:Ger(x)C family spore germination protein n=1 Tax=Neomoorella carbonis TaxID=3062783 RepID=UPI003246E022
MSKRPRLLLFTSILAAFTLAVLAGGCWDRREINELAFLSCAAFDMEGGHRVLTSEFIRPSTTAGGGERGGGEALPQRQALIVSDRDETFMAIGREKALGLPRRAYLAHTTAVLVGEEMARYGIKEVLDFVDRNPEIRRTTLVLLTRGPAREVVVRAQSGLEKNLGKEIAGLHKWAQVSGYGFIPNINDVFFDLSGDAGTTVLPVLELNPQPFPPILSPGGAAGGSPAGRAGEPETLMTARLNGAGLFYHDKLVAWLDKEQTRGWAWVRNRVKGAVLALPCQENNLVSVNVITSQAETGVDMQGGRLQGKIKVRVEGNLLEEQCRQDFTKEEAVKSLESRMADQITAEISSALNAAKTAGTDVFGFGGALHRRYPEVWRQLQGRWSEEFKKLPVTISVEAKLRRTGMTGRPWQPGAH